MKRRREGFALVLVVVVLGLLVLLAYALAALAKVEAQVAATAARRMQARQHALTGLDLAIGALQRAAGPDDRVTGMAGITGLPPGSGSPTRHWAGVWTDSGAWIAWLASGAGEDVRPASDGGEEVVLVGRGSVGAPGPEQEHVRVRLVPVPGRDEAASATERLAWWVGDEGVKLSARVPAADEPAPGARHGLDELIAVLDPADQALERLLTYEQLVHVPAEALSPGVLRARFHAVGRTHAGLVRAAPAARLQAGALNVNTTSRDYWRGVAATFNRGRSPVRQLAISPTTFAERVSAGFAGATGPGKRAGGPFTSVDAFLDSPLLVAALEGAGVSPLEFRDGLSPWLTVRSETFRVRAYGEARNPAEPGAVEAAAWCEAIVQRVPEELPGFGRRFVIVGFRWLGPDDI